MIALALMGSPRLLLIDELTHNLDPAVAKELLVSLRFIMKKLKRGLIFTSKQREEMNLIADSILDLNLAQDVSKQLTSQYSRIQVNYSLRGANY